MAGGPNGLPVTVRFPPRQRLLPRQWWRRRETVTPETILKLVLLLGVVLLVVAIGLQARLEPGDFERVDG